ncbi:hypothetical protein F383_33789 [Gossypium arboreum]|uniref:Uncharacterized protein n=3 Tax=Gossypium TaxID=3633 RepID=A0ABR0P3A7_GOSAR|nr:uncharacterized protein LOC108469095 [Gossypium arboreum]KAK5812172.1 hypothetical protein PVK06_027587 [Gossypium arboreum]KHG06933.1 hypothetical protein F383_33789 [Gossypium arboreum]TYJ22335.1 hypothetical protein E1A91_A08G118600v1 [Gossypium mustelinum]
MGLTGDSSMGHYADWGSNKYKGSQNGYAVAYTESECYNQIHKPTHGMIKPQKAYGMAETWDEEHAQSYATYKSQTGPPMFKTQVHGPSWNGFGFHSNTATAHMQSYGFSSPGRNEGRVYGYEGPTPAARHRKSNGGMGHGFDNHGNYEKTKAYGYEESNGYGEYTMNGMARTQPHLRGKHTGHGNGFVKNQAYGPTKNMGFGYTEAEYNSHSKEEQYQYYGGTGGYHAGNDHSAKGLIRNNSGDNSCSDSESDNDDDDYGFKKKVWVSRAI